MHLRARTFNGAKGRIVGGEVSGTSELTKMPAHLRASASMMFDQAATDRMPPLLKRWCERNKKNRYACVLWECEAHVFMSNISNRNASRPNQGGPI